MNPDLTQLQPYPFERLAQLLRGVTPPAEIGEISLAIGEPKHPVPPFITQALQQALPGIGQYPNSLGSEALRQSIALWLEQRFDLSQIRIDPQTQVLPVCGTREALFAFAQAVIERGPRAKVLMPNPFYQIYEGAALMAGAEPLFIPTDASHGWLPNFRAISSSQWDDCQLLYLCSPSNPTGAVLSIEQLQALITLAHRHDFIIASDECYSEIFLNEDEPPAGLLQAAAAMGLNDYARCVVFHSLSKRSNVPGLRSGFVAGDAAVLAQFRHYRTYHGSTMSPAIQAASAAAWADEAHVEDNRRLYREKFKIFLEELDAGSLDGRIEVAQPMASFYLWPQLNLAGEDDESLSKRLLAEANLRVVPGRYLGREVNGINPGVNHLRLSLVPSLDDCREAARRLRQLLLSI